MLLPVWFPAMTVRAHPLDQSSHPSPRKCIRLVMLIPDELGKFLIAHAKIRNWVERPSGIHLGHYHALIDRHCHKDSPNSPECELLDTHQEALINAHLSLINYALHMGISYDRWETVVNIMLEKDPDDDPKIH